MTRGRCDAATAGAPRLDAVREDELRDLAGCSPWLIRALGVVRDSGLPDA